MLIDCKLRTWIKQKGDDDSRYYEVPIYNIHHYQEDYVIKYALHIVHLDSEGHVGKVLEEKVFIPDGKSTHYIYFCGASYQYDESKNIIYTTDTVRNI